MAEARTDEEEEGGLETREEPVVRRQPRPGAGGDRPNRRKPEHRHSQGPLSSIRAVLKRTTTRSTSVCEGPRERERERVPERERDRRRPEITILSAEPLSATSWFPGGSGGFPPPPPPASQIWGPTIPPSIQPPPSYEEVIREKSQERVLLPPPSSSLLVASSSSCLRAVSTATSATQTDLGPPPPDTQCAAAVRRPSRPPRPSFPAPPRPLSLVDDIISTDADQSSLRPARTDGLPRPLSPLTSASSAQTDQWEPLSVVAPPPPSNPAPHVPAERPRPRPRSKLIEKQVSADIKVQTLVKLREDGLATLAALGRGSDITDQGVSQGKYLQELLEAFSSDDWGFPEDRRGDSGPSQSESEEEEEEEEDMAKLKARTEAFQQEHPPLSDGCHGDVGNVECTAAPTRPEPRPRLQGQPAKPAPPIIAPKPKPQCKEFWEDGGSPTPDSEKPPSPPPGSHAPKPSPRPRPAPRASLGATPPPRPPSLPGTRTERKAQDPGRTTSTPPTTTASATADTVKTGSDRPAVPGKPSSLTMSSRRASAPSLGSKPTGSPTPPSLGVKPPTLPAAPQAQTQRKSSLGPPPRPSGVKALPLRPPPIKTVPGRPPPPTVNPTSSSVANQTAPSRTKLAPSVSSAIQKPSSVQESAAPSSVPSNHMQGQKAMKKGPPLPPRPKPGHPLYISYMLQKQEVLVVLDNSGSTPPIPQLIKEQSVDQSTCLLDIQPELLPGLDSQSKVVSEEFGISDIQSSLMVQPSKQKDPEVSPISGPRCVARCDYDGQEEDELTFSQGDVIALSELIGQDWGRGQIHGRTGIFPLSFTQVLQPLPPPSPMATTKGISLTKDVTLLENTEPTSSEVPVVKEQEEKQEEWALAMFNFPGQTVDDLSFQQGALIRVLQHIDSDWRRGRVEDREGLYPVAFTEPYTAQPTQGQQPAGGGVAKALFDFTAESEDELTLKIGDIIREVESLDEQWIVGVVGGKRGAVPKNYISLL